MVLKKKTDRGQNGFQVPVIPRAPRSLKRRGTRTYKRAVEDNGISAIELLASLAGKLLQETESSSASSNASEGCEQPGYGTNVDRQEQNVFTRPPKSQCIDRGTCGESVYVTELAGGNVNQKESGRDECDSNMECTSIVSSSDCSGKVEFNLNLEGETSSGNFDCKLEGTFPINGECCISTVDKGIGQTLDVNKEGSLVMTNDTRYSAKDKMVHMGESAKLAPNRSPVTDTSFSRHRNDISLGSRDDNENFSRFCKSRSNYKAFRPAKRIGDRKMRKLLMSKYWEVALKLKNSELPLPDKKLHIDGRWKAAYHKRKSCYNHDKSKHDSLRKRQKLLNQSSIIISDGGISSESVSNSPEKGVNGEKNGLAANFDGVSGVSSSVIGHRSSFLSKSSHVKFSIKSFKVPELYIEVPESETVGSLKRVVMEAVTALFGGGLHVGVLHQGRKVRDDNWTLSQAGITHMDTPNFTLEPNSMQNSPPVNAEITPIQLCEILKPLKRSATAPILDSGMSDRTQTLALPSGSNCSATWHESASNLADMSIDKAVTDTRALVSVPPLNVEALAVVPVNQKTKRSESAQRRTRTPFSVTEVEALVQAVEKHGTGRWRDVKFQAFEKADHRTYVDLKDKWKTLVHTASILPQQRRGEPVPQELLDRVLAAHAYWSQHQARPNCKQQVGTLRSSIAQGDRNGISGIAMA